MQNSVVCVTGASGYVASHIVYQLLAKGISKQEEEEEEERISFVVPLYDHVCLSSPRVVCVFLSDSHTKQGTMYELQFAILMIRRRSVCSRLSQEQSKD